LRRRRIAIVGAGPVGLVAAMYLAQRNFEVEVYEGRADPRRVRPPGGRSISLTLAERGWHALRDVGAHHAVEQITVPLSDRLIHAQDGSVRQRAWSASS
jgi:kynurenine 3-monooxygenase